MYFETDRVYHIYNRSNETTFINRENYLYFLKKVNVLIKPYVEVLSWCLMPNHFHFLVLANEEACRLIDEPHRPNVQILSKNIGTLLSSYTRAFNKHKSRKGSLFVHNTLSKCLNEAPNNAEFLSNCIHYIHQNPLRAGLCEDISDYEYSSSPDYANTRNGQLVNKELAYEMLGLTAKEFKQQTEVCVNEAKVKGLF